MVAGCPVATSKPSCRWLAAKLAAEGIEAAAFTADLARFDTVPSLIAAIESRLGPIDVAEYSPIAGAIFTPAVALDADALQTAVKLYLLTPVEIARAVLPGMIKRGNGAILVTHGSTAAYPMPNMSGIGPVMAATRNWLYSLNAEVADKGVYAGSLVVTAMIANSAVHKALTSGEMKADLPEGAAIPVVDPDELAERYWQMLAKREQVEEIYPAIG